MADQEIFARRCPIRPIRGLEWAPVAVAVVLVACRSSTPAEPSIDPAKVGSLDDADASPPSPPRGLYEIEVTAPGHDTRATPVGVEGTSTSVTLHMQRQTETTPWVDVARHVVAAKASKRDDDVMLTLDLDGHYEDGKLDGARARRVDKGAPHGEARYSSHGVLLERAVTGTLEFGCTAGPWLQEWPHRLMLDALALPLPGVAVGEGTAWRTRRTMQPNADIGCPYEETVDYTVTRYEGAVVDVDVKMHARAQGETDSGPPATCCNPIALEGSLSFSTPRAVVVAGRVTMTVSSDRYPKVRIRVDYATE